jgi:hypothetical protein
MIFPGLPLLMAFSLGVMIEKGIPNPQVVRTLVREPGAPLEFTVQVRTKATIGGEWEYLAEDKFDVFPGNLKTSDAGRKVTVRLPATGLKKYAQICALHTPKPDPAKNFQALISLQSCQNVPRASLDQILSP